MVAYSRLPPESILFCACIAGLLLTSGLIVYGIDDHDLRITDQIILESSVSDLYVCFWLAVAGAVVTATSIVFLALTIYNKTKDSKKDQKSMISSQSSLKSYDNLSFRKKLSDRPYDGSSSSSSSEYSEEEEELRAPHPFIPKTPVSMSGLSDIRVGKGVDAKTEDFESDTDDVMEEEEDDSGDSGRKLNVYIPTGDGILKEYERIFSSPESLLEFTEDRQGTPDHDIPSEKLYFAEGRSDTSEVDFPPKMIYSTGGRTKLPPLPMAGEHDSEHGSDATEDYDNQYQLTGQQIGTPVIRKFGLTPVETPRQSPSTPANKYLLDPGTQGILADNSGPEDNFPISFENPLAPAMAPTDTRGLFAPVVLASKKKGLFTFPSVFKKHKLKKKKIPKKHVFFDRERTETSYDQPVLPTPQYPEVSLFKRKRKHVYFDPELMKTTYDQPVWQIPEYPELPFYKRKRKHVTSTKVKKKSGVPSFKDTIRHSKKDFKQRPPLPTNESEC